MGFPVIYLLYALVFLSIVMVIQGGYLFGRSNNAREIAVNRRMQVARKSEENTVSPTLLRNKVLGGPVTRFLLSAMPHLEHAFWAANLKITPGQAFAYAAAAFAFVVLLFQTTSIMPPMLELAVAAAICFGIPLLLLNVAVSQQRKKFDDQLPDALNLVTRGLQAGHPVQVAFSLVAKEMPDPIGTEFGNALDEMNFGRDRAEALRAISARYPNPEFMFFIAAVEMQRESGGNLVTILDNLVTIIRERSNLKKKALAVSAEGRLTAVIVGALPYLLLGFLLATNPDFILGSIDEPLFWPLMVGAWCLWLFGMVVIWRMVNIKV
jgi:tight adherence protein B